MSFLITLGAMVAFFGSLGMYIVSTTPYEHKLYREAMLRIEKRRKARRKVPYHDPSRTATDILLERREPLQLPERTDGKP